MSKAINISRPFPVPVVITAAYVSRFHSDGNSEVRRAVAEIVHAHLNPLIDNKSRSEQHDASCEVARGQILYVWVTVDDTGKIALADTPQIAKEHRAWCPTQEWVPEHQRGEHRREGEPLRGGEGEETP